MTIAEIKKLSSHDKIALMEQIWDSFQSDEEDVSSPEWHTPIIEKRMKSISDGTAEFVKLDSLRA